MTKASRCSLAVMAFLFAATVAAGSAAAQTRGGILQVSHFDSPASMSVHEEATARHLGR